MPKHYHSSQVSKVLLNLSLFVFKGFLERPAVPPSFVQDSYKLAFVGKSGVGKTSLINLLVNGGNQTVISPGETPGIDNSVFLLLLTQSLFHSKR